MGAALVSHVREHRLRAGLAQEDLAAAAGVTRQTIIAIEKGKYLPSVLLALRIARRLQIPVEELFSHD